MRIETRKSMVETTHELFIDGLNIGEALTSRSYFDGYSEWKFHDDLNERIPEFGFVLRERINGQEYFDSKAAAMKSFRKKLKQAS